jgi:YVTN family beta-propeller protein
VILALQSGGSKTTRARTTTTTSSSATPISKRTAERARTVVIERATGALPAPGQDAAGASAAGQAILLGGLTAADTSSDAIVAARPSAAHVIGQLPSARHDTAAVAIGRFVYLFGGGNGVSQLDEIVRVDPVTGRATVVGHLPAASSDSSAAEVGGTAYIVGGYTGTSWLDTIVAWRPGSSARVVAHLPDALRYAAVGAAQGRIVIAGGSLENGTASRAVLDYRPAGNRVTRLGLLPLPTTHAAAAELGSAVYVIGGRGASPGTATARIVAIDPGSGRIRPVGHLLQPLSDLTAVALGGGILVAGGSGAGGTVAAIGELVVKRVVAAARRAPLASNGVDVYAHDGANMLAPAARAARPLIYVPNSQSSTVDVIDPRTYRVVEHFSVGQLPQHVVPAWNLKTLYVTNDLGNSLTPIDPRTGKPGRPIPVDDPYNMYFTPNGRHAIVVAERLRRLDFRNPSTFALQHSLEVPCAGIDHMDFSADGGYLIASCEFSGQLVKVDVASERVVGSMTLPDGRGAMPQDVKLSPDGRIFYVADMQAGGVWEVDGASFRTVGFIRTGAGAHGLYPSRNSKLLYVSNRTAGSISVISFRTRRVVATWQIPGGGSPDMGGVSANGKVLWLSGRYNAVVYAISTHDGRLIAKIPVGQGPHGLCVWPQPGRYSLGHTGILR